MLSLSYLAAVLTVLLVSVIACAFGEQRGSRDNSEISDFSSVKRASDSLHVLKKRAPGWGKRTVDDIDDELSYDSDDSPEDMLARELSKRAPGWGKRTIDSMGDYSKRAPGWGKRSPGWGKRDNDMEKRAPGWGKRSPGWGKRSPGWGKRSPGWGKRAPGWGKRAPGWGKRSGVASCDGIDDEVDYYIYRAVQAEARRIVECGSKYQGKDLTQK